MPDLAKPERVPYLAQRLARGVDELRIFELGGGVSNTVLLVETSTGERLVVKQALGKLRVEQDWFCTPERIWRECAAIRRMGQLGPQGTVPEILFEDRQQHIFAMTAAPVAAVPWKQELLDGTVRLDTAEQVGRLLGVWIRASHETADLRESFADLTVMDALRLDPYYRSTAARHPDLAGHFHARIHDCCTRRTSLVHGDFSPKNLLVSPGLMAIDFEVVHWGDPSFDAGFLLNHLALKSVHRPEYAHAYLKAAESFRVACVAETPRDFSWLFQGALEHLGCLMLARIDGKSPVEYLRTTDKREAVRRAARRLILNPSRTVEEAFEVVFQETNNRGATGD